MSTDFLKNIEKYRKIISGVNFLWKQPAVFKANPDLHISAAYGFCSKAEEPDLGAKEIYRKADGRMYECKVAMKCQRI